MKDTDRTFGGLPPAEVVKLGAAQIDVAVAEVRFSRDRDSPFDGGALLSACGAAGLSLTRIEPLRQVELTFGPTVGGAPASNERIRGWQLTSSDQRLTITVSPDVVTVQNARYRRWRDDLGGPLHVVLGVVAQLQQGSSIVNRVGLRYVNRLGDQGIETPRDWAAYIAPSMIGALAHPVFGGMVLGTQNQLELALEETVGAVLRHGAFSDAGPDGHHGYLLDIDVYQQAASVFDVETTYGTARRLNRTALSLFQAIVTPSFRDRRDPQPIDDAGEEG